MLNSIIYRKKTHCRKEEKKQKGGNSVPFFDTNTDVFFFIRRNDIFEEQ